MLGKRGHKRCFECDRSYNNAAVPEFCVCGNELGGSFVPQKPKADCFKISECLFSVIEHKTGPTKRVFVNCENNFCESKKCSDKRANIINSGGDCKTFTCEHLTKIKEFSLPAVTPIILSNVRNVLTPEAFETLSSFANDDRLLVKNLGIYHVVDSLSPKAHQIPFPYCHVKGEKCDLQGCKNTRRIHALAASDCKFCLHELLICLAKKCSKEFPVLANSREKAQEEDCQENSRIENNNEENCQENVRIENNNEEKAIEKKDKEKFMLKIDYKSTISNVLQDVIQNFPKMHETEKQKQFLKLEKINLTKIKSLETSKTLMEEIKLCIKCGQQCEVYSHNKKTTSYLLTLGAIDTVKIPAFHCTTCDIVQYPKIASLGFVNVHNKLILSYPFLMDVYNLLVNGTAMIQCLESKITLFSQCAELTVVSARYLAMKIEKASVAILSALITAESMDSVVCLICGCFPKIINTDGEVKDSVAIKENMVFEDTDEPIPTLEDFLWRLQVQVLSMAKFQHVPPLKHNLYLLPKLIAPILRGVQQNSEKRKRTQFGDVDTDVDLHELEVLVRSGELDVQNLGKYSGQELKDFAVKCDIDISKKSGVALKDILLTSYKRLASGESNCHKYVIQQKRTGGHQDAWCDHLFKVGACFQTRQESVSDPSDLVHSLKMLPVLHIHDDPCTLISHSFLTKPKLSATIYGNERRGCFTPPNKDVPASASLTPDCEDILPLKYSERVFDVSAATDGGIRHPDTGHDQRWVMGHRLQTNSHKKNTCSYQMLDLTKSGRMVKSLTQEGKQVVRKYKNVRQDRTRNFGTSFLFNYILDFSHNLSKYKKQSAELNTTERNPISWRASFNNQAGCGLADIVEMQGNGSTSDGSAPKAKKAKH